MCRNHKFLWKHNIPCEIIENGLEKIYLINWFWIILLKINIENSKTYLPTLLTWSNSFLAVTEFLWNNSISSNQYISFWNSESWRKLLDGKKYLIYFTSPIIYFFLFIRMLFWTNIFFLWNISSFQWQNKKKNNKVFVCFIRCSISSNQYISFCNSESRRKLLDGKKYPIYFTSLIIYFFFFSSGCWFGQTYFFCEISPLPSDRIKKEYCNSLEFV